jgi:hypothetical protein
MSDEKDKGIFRTLLWKLLKNIKGYLLNKNIIGQSKQYPRKCWVNWFSYFKDMYTETIYRKAQRCI